MSVSRNMVNGYSVLVRGFLVIAAPVVVKGWEPNERPYFVVSVRFQLRPNRYENQWFSAPYALKNNRSLRDRSLSERI